MKSPFEKNKYEPDTLDNLSSGSEVSEAGNTPRYEGYVPNDKAQKRLAEVLTITNDKSIYQYDDSSDSNQSEDDGYKSISNSSEEQSAQFEFYQNQSTLKKPQSNEVTTYEVEETTETKSAEIQSPKTSFLTKLFCCFSSKNQNKVVPSL